MMGLDNAGKSTILYRMRTGQYCETIPTIGFNCEKVKGKLGKSKNITFTIWDVGGQDKVRPLWRTYAKGAEGIMFVIDSADHDTLEECRMELSQLFLNPEMHSLPILLLANKQDLPNALDLDYLNKYFLKSFTDSGTAAAYSNRQIVLRSTCAVTGDGLFEALDQLYDMIINRNKNNKSKNKIIKKR
jgi:ADP-ribosylation factor-like protein 4